MKQHQLVLVNSSNEFVERVNTLTQQGWLVVPGTTVIKETRSGRPWFSVVMESQEPDSLGEVLLRDRASQLARYSHAVSMQYRQFDESPPDEDVDHDD